MNRSIKQANGLFLCIILLYMGMVVLLSYLALYGFYAGKVFTLLIGEALIGVPALLLLIWNRKSWRSWIRVKRVRFSTVLLSVLFAYLLMPIAMLANVISMIFVENSAAELIYSLSDLPLALLVFIIGIYGPACEELAFRGVLLGRYKRSGKILTSVVLSAILFGLMHLNGNQFGYAAILGFAFALLMEAAGSIWVPFIVHMVINTHNTLMALMSARLLELTGTQEAMTEFTYTSSELALTIGVLLPVAAFSTILAVGVYILIARNEGRMEYVKYIFQKKSKKLPEANLTDTPKEQPHFVTWTLVVAVVICVFIIFVLPFLRVS